MKTAGRVLVVAALAALAIVGAPATAFGALSITAPVSTDLDSAPTGSATLTAQLGTVTATKSAGILQNVSMTATVSCTDFKTGGLTLNETIGKAQIYYWSGVATNFQFTGLLGSGSNTPGQPTEGDAVSLSAARTAFTASASGVLGLGTSVSVSWNPTIVVHIPSAAVVGTYSGTITHSVA